MLLPNKQRYHSDDFKKQRETQKILSAIGCGILKIVGTSCGLGLDQTILILRSIFGLTSILSCHLCTLLSNLGVNVLFSLVLMTFTENPNIH